MANFGLQAGSVNVNQVQNDLSVDALPTENVRDIRDFDSNLAGLFYRALTTDRGDGSGVLQFIEGDDGELLLRITYGTRQYYNPDPATNPNFTSPSQLLQNPQQIYPTGMPDELRLMDESNLLGHSATGSYNTLGDADWIDPVRDPNYLSVTVPFSYFTTQFSTIRRFGTETQTQLNDIIICLIGAFLFMNREPQTTSTTTRPRCPPYPPTSHRSDSGTN